MRGPATGAPRAARILNLAVIVATFLCVTVDARKSKQQLVVCQSSDKVCSSWPQLDHELRHRLLSSGHVCGHALTDPLRTIEGLDNFIPIRTPSGELQYLQCNSVQYRFRRQAPGYGPRGKYRGQTQSQYLSIDHTNGGDDGKAEAHSAADSSHATVSGKSGMGQAQSQSMYDPSCDDCLGKPDSGVENLQRLPGQPGSSQFGGRDDIQGGIGVPGSRPSIGIGTPGWNGYPGRPTPNRGISNEPFGHNYGQSVPVQGQSGIPGTQGQLGQHPDGTGHGQPGSPGAQGPHGQYSGATGQGQPGESPGISGQGQPGQYPGGNKQENQGKYPGVTVQEYPAGIGLPGQIPGGTSQSRPGQYPGGTEQRFPSQYPPGSAPTGQYPGGTGQGQPGQYPGGRGQPGQHQPGDRQAIPSQFPGGTLQGQPGTYPGGTGQELLSHYPGRTGQLAPGQYPGRTGQGQEEAFPGGFDQNQPGRIQSGGGPQAPRSTGQELPTGMVHGQMDLPGQVGKDQPGQMILPNTGYGHNGLNQGPGGGSLPGVNGQRGYDSRDVPYGSTGPGGVGPHGAQNGIGPYGQLPGGNIPYGSKDTGASVPNYGQQQSPRGTFLPGSEGNYPPVGVNQGPAPTGTSSSGPSGYMPGLSQPGTNQYGLKPGYNQYESQPGSGQYGPPTGLIPQGGSPGSLLGTHVGPNGEIIYCCVVSPGQGNLGQPGSTSLSDLSRPGYGQPGISSRPYQTERGSPGGPNNYSPGSTSGGQQSPGGLQPYIPGSTGPSQTYTPESHFTRMTNEGQPNQPGFGLGTIDSGQHPRAGTINGGSRPYYPGGGEQLYSPEQERVGQPDTIGSRGVQNVPGLHPSYTQGPGSPGYQNGGGPYSRPGIDSYGSQPYDAGVSTSGQPFQQGQGPAGPRESHPGVGTGTIESSRPGESPGLFPGSQIGSQGPNTGQIPIPGQGQLNGQVGPQGPGGKPGEVIPGQTTYPYPGSINQGGIPGQTGYLGPTNQGGYPGGPNYPDQVRYPGQTNFPDQVGASRFPGTTYPNGAPGHNGYPGQINPAISGPPGYPGQQGHGGTSTGFPGQTIQGGTPGQTGYPGQTSQGGAPGQAGIPGGLPTQGGVFPPGAPGTIYSPGGQGPYSTSYGGTPAQNGPNAGVIGHQSGAGNGPGAIAGYGQLPFGGQPGYTPGGGVPGVQTGYPVVPGTSTDLNGIPQNVIDPNSISPSLDDDSDALASVSQDINGTIASASSKGGNSKGRAQTQVQGTYTGTGTFSAQAQISDETKGAESQVSGGKQGASSTALGRGRNNKSQANVQLGSETGSLQTQAQSEGSSHSSNTQVQGSVKGGMADAQARGPGSTSSQAQIGFTPYKEGDKAHDALKTPFVGGGTASAQSTGRIGQSQSQLQGTFKYGISYNGAAQAGSSIDREAVFPNRLPFNKIDVFDEKNKNIDVNPEPTPSSTSAPEESSSSNIVNDNKATWDDRSSHTHSDHHKNDQQTKGNSNTPTPVGGRKSFRPATSFDYNAEKEEIPEEYDPDDYEPEGNDEPYEPDDAILETVDDTPSLLSTSRKSLNIKQTIGGNTQHIVLGPLHNQDAEIIQKNSERPDLGKVYQPGDIVPGTGYTIPQGFTGSVKAVSSRDKTYAIGSDSSPSQAQTVALRPGTGKVNYMYPSGAATTPYGKNVNSENLRSLSNSKPNSNYLSVSKSITGALDGDNNIKKQYAHTYYTKSSSCGYFTFTCTVVTGSNGRKKVCKPKIPTNPDGTPMKC